MTDIIDQKMCHFKNECELQFYKDSVVGFWKRKTRNGINMNGLISVIKWKTHHLGMMGEEKLTCAD